MNEEIVENHIQDIQYQTNTYRHKESHEQKKR
jgi:hypothetical protein